MRYGNSNSNPSGFALPVDPSFEVSLAICKRIGIGVAMQQGKNFVGYRLLRGSSAGYYLENTINYDSDAESGSFNFANNHTLKTRYIGVSGRLLLKKLHGSRWKLL